MVRPGDRIHPFSPIPAADRRPRPGLLPGRLAGVLAASPAALPARQPDAGPRPGRSAAVRRS
ncbi:hypothetical protein ACFSM7_09800 [Clavibacter michiganensis subsp. tessellarius]|uniref:hypothetical protein n=1 Tax=Clavibacter tessellarius TaxID=31965 RepID=UPI00363AF78E